MTKFEVTKPKTIMEAVESLEEFLVCDFGANDWSTDFLRTHFKLCKDMIIELQTGERLSVKKIRTIPVAMRSQQEHLIMMKHLGGVREYLLSMGKFKDVPFN